MSKGTLNKVMLIGRLGGDPELRYAPNGAAVCTFSLATDDSYKDSDGKQVSKTDWHKVVTWRKLAEIVGQYCVKGSLVYVEGKIKTRAYDDKDGGKKYITEITADTVQFLSKNEGKPEKQVEYQPSEETETSGQDELPF